MTGLETITKFRNMVDDTLDADYEYQLLNDAKDEIEALEIWEVLKKSQAYSVTSGYTYTTALGALPTRFALDLSMVEGTSNLPYEKVSFEDHVNKVNVGNGYFIDMNAGNIYLSGSNHASKTMTFYYTEYSADLTSSTSWAFPSRFHNLLALKMAQLYYASDAGEKDRSWDDRWSAYFASTLARALIWNDSLKTRNKRSRSAVRWENSRGINI